MYADKDKSSGKFNKKSHALSKSLKGAKYKHSDEERSASPLSNKNQKPNVKKEKNKKSIIII